MARRSVAPPDRIALHGAGAALVTLARFALTRRVEVAWHHPDERTETASLSALDLGLAAEERAGRLTAAARAAAWARLRGAEAARLHIHADRVPKGLTGAQLALGGADGHLGLAIAPQGGICELALPPEAEATEDAAVAFAGLRRLGLLPVVVGRRPILGAGLAAAGQAALAWLVAAGTPRGRLAAVLERFGTRLPEGLPEPRFQPGHGAEDVSDEECLARWLGALANEGLRLLDQGVALRPSDIDLVLVNGHGFPRWRGGPMHLADRRGLMALRADLRRWAADDPVWAPASGLDRLIRDGARLADTDGRA